VGNNGCDEYLAWEVFVSRLAKEFSSSQNSASINQVIE
jgi:hypothetical protein